MLIDYHTHHVRCGHAEGELEQYVKRGIEIGLDQLGLSDHMPLLHVDPATYFSGMAMPLVLKAIILRATKPRSSK
jgi:histidinol-phosphatase (PHP family)